jgi:hypothetical protein
MWVLQCGPFIHQNSDFSILIFKNVDYECVQCKQDVSGGSLGNVHSMYGRLSVLA